MNRLSQYNDADKGRDFVIVGAGASLKDHYQKIKQFIHKENLVTIGINKITNFIIPDYHLWTNNRRLHDQMDCIDKRSKLMLGIGIIKNLRILIEALDSDYIQINYINKPLLKYKYVTGIIYGNFRTAGVLAIAIAKILGAKNIYVVGMDGFCLHTRDDLKKKNKNHHCYGFGFTDDATYHQCSVKDSLVRSGLESLKEADVEFKLITPTVFTEFFEDVMGICK